VLILFDIDATLLTTNGAGVQAMADAGRDLFGPEFRSDGVDYAGRLDPLILADLLSAHGLDGDAAGVERFRAAYAEHLERRLAKRGTARALPGVADLLGSLTQRADLAVGLLTGNYPETGAMKLRAAGLDPEVFSIQVWGCDSPHDPPERDHLPAVALERHRAGGVDLEAARVTIIGDTPHDVRCARAHGCRSLGVATGRFDEAALIAAGADRTVADLSETEPVLRWLTMMD